MKKNEPLVSIIVPVYNAELYIRECIESIIKQTYNNLEIILIDDGSIDNSKKIIDLYKENDKRIRYYYQKNSGVSVTRNNGKNKSTGDYIMYVDSDDCLVNNAIELLVNISREKNPDIIIFNYNEIRNGKIYAFKEEDGKIRILDRDTACYEYIRGSDKVTFIIWRKFYKRQIALSVDFPQNVIPEDMATGFDFLLNSNKIIYYNKNLYNYRLLKNSLTLVNDIQKVKNIYIINKIEYKKRIEIFEQHKNLIESKYCNSLIYNYGLFKQFNDEEAKIYLKKIKNDINNIKYKNLNIKSKIIYILFYLSKRSIVFLVMNKQNKKIKKRIVNGE